MRRLTAILVIGSVILLGIGSVVSANSPYDSNVHSEKNPFAPERPATLNNTTASVYLIEYEQTRLYNDLLRSRGYMLDSGDDVRTDCTVVSTNQTTTSQFRVRLRCHGAIMDTNRLIQPTDFIYNVTYSVTEDSQRQLSLHGYPYSVRDDLRQRPPSAA